MSSKKPWSTSKCKAVQAKRTITRKRAGRRKCYRCKVVWDRPRGVMNILCPRCTTHCSRCDVLLTADNSYIETKYKGPTRFRCKPCICEVSKLTQDKDRNRDSRLIKNYGITAVEYDAILKAQDMMCWICQKLPKEGGNRLAVDHLHSKGEKKRNPREKRDRIRGLLCWGCNASVGRFKDDITKLRRAADYLERWPAQAILKKEDTNGNT